MSPWDRYLLLLDETRTLARGVSGEIHRSKGNLAVNGGWLPSGEFKSSRSFELVSSIFLTEFTQRFRQGVDSRTSFRESILRALLNILSQ